MSSNVVTHAETMVEYGVKHFGRNMAATTVETARRALRRRYRTQLSMAAWGGYANLFLDMTKYVGTSQTNPHRAQIRQDMRGRGDMGEHAGQFMTHETDVPPRDAFPSRWGTIEGTL